MFADAECGFERGDIKKYRKVTIFAESGESGAEPVKNYKGIRGTAFFEKTDEGGCFCIVKQRFRLAVSGFSEQENRVDDAVFGEGVREHGFEFRRTFVRGRNVNFCDGAVSGGIGDAVAENGIIRSDITVKDQDFVRGQFAEQTFCNRFVAHQRFCRGCSGNLRTVQCFRVGESVRFEHETHG